MVIKEVRGYVDVPDFSRISFMGGWGNHSPSLLKRVRFHLSTPYKVRVLQASPPAWTWPFRSFVP